ncbi:Gfo/Idh/MocA family protein [Bradyrhizobium sp. 2TAF24]|uniref:Gfo/Idh/MocA family protein n=1 Tax=Bradyrhizobium sp. 2TAF24 TaxID=3233011 RepID=UPI003F93E122
MIGMAVVGYGYWGQKLARNVAGQNRARLVAIAEPNAARGDRARHDHPVALIEGDALAAVTAPGVEAVVIATPPAQHRAVALAAIAAGKNVLIEKPCGASLDDARAIVAAAQARGLVLMVDHTFIYAPAVEALAQAVGELGDLVYVESTRTNLARFDSAAGVVRDLAIHDLAILDHVLGRTARLVTARGRTPPGEHEDFAFLTLDYAGLPAHLHVDCLSPVKIRRITIGGTRGTVIFDDVEPVEKIRLYRRGDMSAAELRAGLRSGEIASPPVSSAEPLARCVAHFIDCIADGRRPLTDGASALRLLSVVEDAERQLTAASPRHQPG